jgi:hypothetical protein
MTGDTGTTGSTITKIDIITISAITLADGSTLEAGGAMKFSTEFPIGFNGFRFTIQPYRSLEIFKAGYKPVEVLNFLYRGQFEIQDMSTIDMFAIYHLVNGFINAQFPEHISEVVVYQEPAL